MRREKPIPSLAMAALADASKEWHPDAGPEHKLAWRLQDGGLSCREWFGRQMRLHASCREWFHRHPELFA